MKANAIRILTLGIVLSVLGNSLPQANDVFGSKVQVEQMLGQQRPMSTRPKAVDKDAVNGEESTISQVCKNCRLAVQDHRTSQWLI
jgi:hypothetical protein